MSYDDDDSSITIDDVLELGTDNLSEKNEIKIGIQKYHQNPWGSLHVSSIGLFTAIRIFKFFRDLTNK